MFKSRRTTDFPARNPKLLEVTCPNPVLLHASDSPGGPPIAVPADLPPSLPGRPRLVAVLPPVLALPLVGLPGGRSTPFVAGPSTRDGRSTGQIAPKKNFPCCVRDASSFSREPLIQKNTSVPNTLAWQISGLRLRPSSAKELFGMAEPLGS